jgi:hypothetical protein
MTMRAIVRAVRTIATLGVVALWSCQRPAAIWIIGQEAPGRPVFGIGDTVRGRPIWLGDLMVTRCDFDDQTAQFAAWLIVSDGETTVVSRVTYGRVPPGYAVTRYGSTERSHTDVAPPLLPGCYVARIDGSPGTVYFTVAADGSVLETEQSRVAASAAPTS